MVRLLRMIVILFQAIHSCPLALPCSTSSTDYLRHYRITKHSKTRGTSGLGITSKQTQSGSILVVNDSVSLHNSNRPSSMTRVLCLARFVVPLLVFLPHGCDAAFLCSRGYHLLCNI